MSSSSGEKPDLPHPDSSQDTSSLEDIEKDQEQAQLGSAPLPVNNAAVQPQDAVLALKKLDSNVKKKEDQEDPFAHLPDHEREILKKQLDVPDLKVGYLTLYRYATTYDIIFLSVSALMGIAAGAAMPLMTVVFGNLTGQFSGYFQGQMSYDEFVDQLNGY
ncbi:hypothetical protein LTS18_004627, partial [Coniosporium uncinatum]